MVAIGIHSDLHTEYLINELYDKNASINCMAIPNNLKELDYLILAGDIGNLSSIILYLEHIFNINNDIQVIYILGNHEYDGGIFEYVENEYRQTLIQQFPNLIFLEKEYFIDNKNKMFFFGATLWSNYQLGKNKEESMLLANDMFLEIYSIQKHIQSNKKQKIHDFNSNETLKNMTAKQSASEFDKTIVKIKKALKQCEQTIPDFHNYKKIMISHFLPLKETLHPRYNDFIYSAYWCSHIPKIVNLFDIWIYGHSHHNINLQYNNTLVISNQLGYYNKHLKKYESEHGYVRNHKLIME